MLYLNKNILKRESKKDIYFRIQLNVIIYSSFLCSLIQIGFHYMEIEYIYDEFDYSNDRTVPITLKSVILYGIYILSLLVPLYVNYYVFYHYVNKSFMVNDMRRSRLLSEEEIIKISDIKTRRDIKSFLA